MNDSLVKELRSCAQHAGLSIANRAADRIEELEAQLAVPVAAHEPMTGAALNLAATQFEAWWADRLLPENLKVAFFMVWKAALESAVPVSAQDPVGHITEAK